MAKYVQAPVNPGFFFVFRLFSHALEAIVQLLTRRTVGKAKYKSNEHVKIDVKDSTSIKSR